MTTTSIVKQLTNITEGTDGLEGAMIAQVPTYQINTMMLYEIANHSEVDSTCIIGSYLDTALNQYVGFCAVGTPAGVSPPNWIIGDFRVCNDPTAINTVEQGGLFGIVEIPTTSVNWASFAWVAVGHAPDDSYAIGPGDDFLSPVIVGINGAGASAILTSEFGGGDKPSNWNLTNGGADTTRPMMLCDLTYDAENDGIVAVGCLLYATGSTASACMVVEMTTALANPTYAYSINYGVSTSGPLQPAFWRSCAIQTQDASGATVANRTIVMMVGYGNNTAVNPGLIGPAVWGVYQPNFSNPWAGIPPRMGFIDRGINNANDFFDLQGLATADKPNDLSLCRHLTADEEDIYLIGGITTNGPFVYGVSGLTTDSTGGGDDNIINPVGVNTALAFAEIKNLSSSFILNNPNPVGFRYGTQTGLWDAIALPQRKTKLYSMGFVYTGINAPISPAVPIGADGNYGSILLAVSRGFNLFSNEIVNSYATAPFAQSMFNDPRMKIALMPMEATSKIMLLPTPYRWATPLVVPELVEASVATGHGAYAWFEYMLYDGVDALIARKLNEMGIRVTIGNVEWYKQDIIKQNLDVSTDFFNEWAELQVHENQEREREAEQFGRKRYPKRAVRTEVFDDYADWEEKEEQVKAFPDYDPHKDGQPFQDDVAKEQQIEKTQKAVDDLRKIEEVIEEGDVDESEYDDAADVSDWGEN
jgi:hypothetical protein